MPSQVIAVDTFILLQPEEAILMASDVQAEVDSALAPAPKQVLATVAGDKAYSVNVMNSQGISIQTQLHVSYHGSIEAGYWSIGNYTLPVPSIATLRALGSDEAWQCLVHYTRPVPVLDDYAYVYSAMISNKSDGSLLIKIVKTLTYKNIQLEPAVTYSTTTATDALSSAVEQAAAPAPVPVQAPAQGTITKAKAAGAITSGNNSGSSVLANNTMAKFPVSAAASEAPIGDAWVVTGSIAMTTVDTKVVGFGIYMAGFASATYTAVPLPAVPGNVSKSANSQIATVAIITTTANNTTTTQTITGEQLTSPIYVLDASATYAPTAKYNDVLVNPVGCEGSLFSVCGTYQGSTIAYDQVLDVSKSSFYGKVKQTSGPASWFVAMTKNSGDEAVAGTGFAGVGLLASLKYSPQTGVGQVSSIYLQDSSNITSPQIGKTVFLTSPEEQSLGYLVKTQTTSGLQIDTYCPCL